MNPKYLATARLLVEIAPVVFESGAFALKGGTAINLFLRDMPRLSWISTWCSATTGFPAPRRYRQSTRRSGPRKRA